MAKFCKNCGMELPNENSVFCVKCGANQTAGGTDSNVQNTDYAQSQSTTYPTSDYSQSGYSQNNYNQSSYTQSANPVSSYNLTNKPTSIGEWIGWMLLCSFLPIIGQIIMLCASNDESVKNFAKANLVLCVIGIVLTLVIVTVMVVAGISLAGASL